MINNFVSTDITNDVKKKITRKHVYLACQVLGWYTYALANVVFLSLLNLYNAERVIEIVVLALTGLISTHLFRIFIIKKKWLDLPVKKLIPRVIVSTLFIAFIIVIITISFSYAIEPERFKDFNIGKLFIGLFNISAVIFIWSLIYFFIHYFERHRQSEIEKLIWEAAVKDFELKTLKSQLNPHFMFNSLNSIRALIEENPRQAQLAVTQLSNLLRYTLQSEKKETVPLRDEIQAVSDYLALERIRYEERLDFKIEIDPDTNAIEIPPMMVQTLVENGIKHGISRQTDGGFVLINSKFDENKLILEIKNSGSINKADIAAADGFGIKNTKQRLNLLYGTGASFAITNEPDNVVKAKITIPAGGTIR